MTAGAARIIRSGDRTTYKADSAIPDGTTHGVAAVERIRTGLTIDCQELKWRTTALFLKSANEPAHPDGERVAVYLAVHPGDQRLGRPRGDVRR